MRLWSIHLKYLDKQGLLAVWREGLLAQSVLLKKPEKFGEKNRIAWENHPQLERFKRPDCYLIIGMYLVYIWAEASKRGGNY